MTSFGHQFDFHDVDSAITYSLVTLTVDGTASFLQLMDVQNVQTRVTGNSDILFKMAELL